VQQANLIVQIKPQYPIQAGIQGAVVLARGGIDYDHCKFQPRKNLRSPYSGLGSPFPIFPRQSGHLS
jgi:hypothetical protein